MSLGYVIIGMILGFVAAVSIWAAGAGLLMAFLAYVGGGALGMILAVAVSLIKREPTPGNRSAVAS